MKVFGPGTGLGLALAVVACAADQLHKWWMIDHLGLTQGSTLRLTPFLDIVVSFNRGISYGLFPQNSEAGRWTLIAFSFGAIVALVAWLFRLRGRFAAASVGLIIGGAAGNAIDRVHYGAVADFFRFHVSDFSWYIFNLADVAIVAGVIGLLYDALKSGHKSAGNVI